jgi:hypothetical protein
MRRDWFLGLGAFSTLVVLVGIDVTLALVAHEAQRATRVLRGGWRRRGPGA